MGPSPMTSVSHRNWAFYDCRISCCQDEIIGDEYQVFGGISIRALRVANLAFGMRVSSQEMMKPAAEKPIQVGMTESLLSSRCYISADI